MIGEIGEIGSQVADIARTQGELDGLKAARAAHPNMSVEDLKKTPQYQDTQNKYGTGSDFQRGIQAATAGLQGLAGGNIAGALAGASAPELAHIIGHDSGLSSDAALVAHAILGGVAATLQGNSAAAGAAGAVSGELAAKAIAARLYPHAKEMSDLTEEEKQTVSMLATMSAGLAGGLVGDSTVSAGTGALVGKNAVENNTFSLPDGIMNYGQAVASWNQFAVNNNLTQEETQAGVDKIAKGDMPGSTNITKVMVDGSSNMAFAFAAWELGLAASVGKAVVGGVTSAAVNGGFQWYGLNQPGSEDQSWDYKGSASSFITGGLAPGRKVTVNTAIALGGSVFSDGANIKSQAGTALGAYVGGYVGEYFPVILRPVLGSSATAVGDIGGGFVSELINYGIKNNPAPTSKEPEHE